VVKVDRRDPLVRAVLTVSAVLAGMVGVWLIFTTILGTPSPFFVVSSESMVPTLQVGDIIVVDGKVDFDSLKVGDIIVFEIPFHTKERVIVHRVNAIYDGSERQIRTKGDNNLSPDSWRVTEREYIGKVIFTIPKIGYLTASLTPPLNYILVAIVIAMVFMLELNAKKPGEEGGGDMPQPES